MSTSFRRVLLSLLLFSPLFVSLKSWAHIPLIHEQEANAFHADLGLGVAQEIQESSEIHNRALLRPRYVFDKNFFAQFDLQGQFTPRPNEGGKNQFQPEDVLLSFGNYHAYATDDGSVLGYSANIRFPTSESSQKSKLNASYSLGGWLHYPFEGIHLVLSTWFEANDHRSSKADFPGEPSNLQFAMENAVGVKIHISSIVEFDSQFQLYSYRAYSNATGSIYIAQLGPRFKLIQALSLHTFIRSTNQVVENHSRYDGEKTSINLGLSYRI